MNKKQLRHLVLSRGPASFLILILCSFLVLFAERENEADAPKASAPKASAPMVNKGTAQSIQSPSLLSPVPPRKAVPIPTTNAAPKRQEMVAAIPRKTKYLTGEDPEFAARCGWPVRYPQPLAGSLLPDKRIVAYYGNPLSKRMGALGQYPKEEMLSRLKSEVDRWEKADPSHKVQPALHLIAVVAQDTPGKAGKYRMVMPDKVISDVYDWARESGSILFIDLQTGHENIRTLLPRFEWILKNPDVHLAIDPEFNLVGSGKQPGSKVGTYDSADINYTGTFLQSIVKKYNLPPKVLIVHRFTRNMVKNAKQITFHPEVQVVMNMDGWGAPYLKRDTYRDYIVREPVQFTGFKLFYHNDTKKGHPLLTPQELLRLNPTPIYIQYQ